MNEIRIGTTNESHQSRLKFHNTYGKFEGGITFKLSFHLVHDVTITRKFKRNNDDIPTAFT